MQKFKSKKYLLYQKLHCRLRKTLPVNYLLGMCEVEGGDQKLWRDFGEKELDSFSINTCRYVHCYDLIEVISNINEISNDVMDCTQGTFRILPAVFTVYIK